MSFLTQIDDIRRENRSVGGPPKYQILDQILVSENLCHQPNFGCYHQAQFVQATLTKKR